MGRKQTRSIRFGCFSCPAAICDGRSAEGGEGITASSARSKSSVEPLSVGKCREWPVSCALAESHGAASALRAGNVNDGSESRGVGGKQASCGITRRRLAQGGAERILDATPAALSAALRHSKGLRWEEGAARFPLFSLRLRRLLRLLLSSSRATTGLEATTASREAALASTASNQRSSRLDAWFPHLQSLSSSKRGIKLSEGEKTPTSASYG